jgi:hypothetical protein
MSEAKTRLEAIRARWAKATPGPWKPCPMRMYIFGPNAEMIADDGGCDDEFRIRGVGRRLPMDANIEAIAAAPEDVAYGLRVAEAAQAVIGHFERSGIEWRGEPTLVALAAALEGR